MFTLNLDENDVIIALKSEDGVLVSYKLRVYIKDGEKFNLIGCIQNLELSADVKEATVKLNINFPKDVKSSFLLNTIDRIKGLLNRVGCNV